LTKTFAAANFPHLPQNTSAAAGEFFASVSEVKKHEKRQRNL
jgi:hypothetical protein